jgi:SAM-dependent methyltransferase
MTAMSDDDYWRRIGQENPYWGVLAHDRFLGTELSAERKTEFLQSGGSDIALVVNLIERHIRPDFAPEAALDFGCGVGRLLVAMAPIARGVTGVDISPGMLARATAIVGERGLANIRLLHEIPQESFDWINSYIVFQHIEPKKGITLLETLLARLTPDGVVSLHFTIYRDERLFERLARASVAGRYDGHSYINFHRRPDADMPIYDYDLGEVVCCLQRHGVNTMTLHHTDHAGLHGVWIIGARG